MRHLFLILKVIAVITVIYIIDSLNFKFKYEIIFTLLYSIFIFLTFKSLIQSSNKKRIVIKTKEIDWIIIAILVSIGILKIGFIRHAESESILVFGLLPKSISEGVFFFLWAVASMQRNLIINEKGIDVFDWKSEISIKYSDITRWNLTNNLIEFQSNGKHYSFRIYKISNNTIDKIDRKVKEKCTLPNSR